MKARPGLNNKARENQGGLCRIDGMQPARIIAQKQGIPIPLAKCRSLKLGHPERVIVVH
jgi:hypothetical protein